MKEEKFKVIQFIRDLLIRIDKDSAYVDEKAKNRLDSEQNIVSLMSLL